MAKSYLDKNGLTYLWSKIKTYIDNKIDSSGSMTADEKAKLAAIGTLAPTSGASGSLSNKSVTSGTATQYWGSFTVPKGVWVMQCFCDFPANGSGYRYFGLIKSATDTELYQIHYSASCPGYANARARLSFTCIVHITETAGHTWYVGVAQNSGSALTARFRYKAVKISD